MRLATSITARRDGTVRAAGMAGRSYTFTSTPPDGELVADVDDDADLALLLATGHFYPADPADFDAALAKLPAGQGQSQGQSQGAEVDVELDLQEPAAPPLPPLPPVDPPLPAAPPPALPSAPAAQPRRRTAARGGV